MSNEIIKKEFGEILISNVDELLTKYNPQSVQDTFRGVTTVKQALNENDTNIAVIKKNLGETGLLIVLKLHILSLNEAINVHQKITKYQAEEIAHQILSIYYYISIVEINLIFNRAKLGHYGRIQYAITMPDVMLWFQSYSNERMEHFERNQEQQNQQFKTDKTIVDGKLFKTNDAQFNHLQIKVLKAFRETLGEKSQFDQEAYDEFKKTYNK